jgi:hypothetical protein
LGGLEVVRSGVLEGRAGEVGWRIDRELNVIGARGAGWIDLGQQSLVIVLAAIGELAQARLVDAVDLLADGAFGEPRVFFLGDGHDALFAAHDCVDDDELGAWGGGKGTDLGLRAAMVPCMRLELELQLSPHFPARWSKLDMG